MRRFSLVGLLILTACGASEIEQQQLKDGSLNITCQLSMDECLRRVQDQCKNQRYRILEGTSETRLRDAPPFERAYHTSRVHLTCNDDGANVLLSLDSSKAAAPTCEPGATRQCVGPGACKGGQACSADGKGFGNCDCGPKTVTPAAPDAASTPASQPASTGDTPPTAAPAPAPSAAP
jgi:hypothetical protein